jgi:anti-sigma regulatory factor (Ser/Thr protein kinase)
MKALHLLNSYQLQIKNDLTELAQFETSIKQFLNHHQMTIQLADEVLLIAEELLVNTIKHGYRDERQHHINVSINLYRETLQVTLIDDGSPFNPLEQPSPELGLITERVNVGGLGIPLIKQLSDQQHYQYKNGQNIFSFSKTISSTSQTN